MADLSDFIPDLDKQLAASPEVDAGLNDFMENEVIAEWRNNSPVDSGEYVDSIQVTKQAKGGKGQVGATASHAHFVEYGTETMQEYAPRAKTEAHFGNNQA